MRLLVINPNTTASMTEKIGTAARSAASPGTEILAMNPAQGPVSIEGYYDEALSVPGLLHLIQTTPGYDAVIIACFDDTGLDAARCLTDRPVIGIGEAAYHFAAMLANKFSVVTTLARSVRGSGGSGRSHRAGLCRDGRPCRAAGGRARAAGAGRRHLRGEAGGGDGGAWPEDLASGGLRASAGAEAARGGLSPRTAQFLCNWPPQGR